MNQKTDDVIIKTHLGLVSGAKKKNGFLFKGIPYGADTSGKIAGKHLKNQMHGMGSLKQKSLPSMPSI